MASVLFSAVVANLIAESEAAITAQPFANCLEEAGSFTLMWEHEEAKRLTNGDWVPSEKQVLRIGSPRSEDSLAVKWAPFDWMRTCEDWKDAFSGLGIVRNRRTGQDEFQLWRAMTELDGYISCSATRRSAVRRLLSEGQELVRAPVSERRHRSFLIVDKPGSGKSYLVDRLASKLCVRPLRFNISQFLTRDQVIDCFQMILSAQSEAKDDEPLIVFFDEINTKVSGEPPYGLFLDPLENGTFTHQGRVSHLAPCLWLFAGTHVPDEASKSTKAADFMSRQTRFFQLYTGIPEEDLSTVEQVYIGVAAIRGAFPEVNQVSKKVLNAFTLLPAEVGPRATKRLVHSFRYVQYGRVMAHNIPANWPDTLGVPAATRSRAFTQLLEKWNAMPDPEKDLVEIRSRP